MHNTMPSGSQIYKSTVRYPTKQRMDEEVNNLVNSGICFTVVFQGLKYNSYPKNHTYERNLWRWLHPASIESGSVLPLSFCLQSERSQCSMLSSDFVNMWWHWMSGTCVLSVTQTSKSLCIPVFGAYFCPKVLDDQPSLASLCCVSQVNMNYQGDTPFYSGGEQSVFF